MFGAEPKAIEKESFAISARVDEEHEYNSVHDALYALQEVFINDDGLTVYDIHKSEEAAMALIYEMEEYKHKYMRKEIKASEALDEVYELNSDIQEMIKLYLACPFIYSYEIIYTLNLIYEYLEGLKSSIIYGAKAKNPYYQKAELEYYIGESIRWKILGYDDVSDAYMHMPEKMGTIFIEQRK